MKKSGPSTKIPTAGYGLERAPVASTAGARERMTRYTVATGPGQQRRLRTARGSARTTSGSAGRTESPPSAAENWTPSPNILRGPWRSLFTAFRMVWKPSRCAAGKSQPGVLTTQDEIWFPSSKGPVRLSRSDRHAVESRAGRDRSSDGRRAARSESTREISLGPDNAKMEMHYGVMQLRSQERIRFRYMLEGFDKTWSEASPRARGLLHQSSSGPLSVSRGRF